MPNQFSCYETKTWASRYSAKDHYSASKGYMVAESAPPHNKAYLYRKGLLLSKRLKIMQKLYTSKKFLKMGGRKMHNPHPTPLDPSLATSHRNHQNSLAYFSHLAPLVFLFY